MPTPFYHLSVAEDLLQHPSLPNEWRQLFDTQRPAYYFGHTAPDVQVVSGQTRQETHFYSIPLPPAPIIPWERFLVDYPGLVISGQLPPDQIAFLAGYLCHLQADWIWLKQIFLPVFGMGAQWQTLPERLYLHNVLRSYLDFQVLQSLNGNIRESLERVSPQEWLPFVEDDHLRAWLHFLSNQLQPGAAIQTVDVFAARQGIDTEEYYRLLTSEEDMDRRIFVHISRSRLDDYRRLVLDENISLLNNYLKHY